MRYKFKLKTFQVVRDDTYPSLGHAGGPDDVVPVLQAILRDACDADREHFIVLALDARGHIIGFKVTGIGSLTATLVHPREIFGVALAFKAASLIVAHSHPSGDVTPSAEDEALTERLLECGRLLGIPIVDHIVLASSGASGAAWRSIMPRVRDAVGVARS